MLECIMHHVLFLSVLILSVYIWGYFWPAYICFSNISVPMRSGRYTLHSTQQVSLIMPKFTNLCLVGSLSWRDLSKQQEYLEHALGNYITLWYSTRGNFLLDTSQADEKVNVPLAVAFQLQLSWHSEYLCCNERFCYASAWNDDLLGSWI